MKTQFCNVRRDVSRLIPAVVLFLYVSAWPAVHGQNLLSNGSLDDAGPLGPNVTETTVVPGGAGPAAADAWGMFTNTPGTITTQLFPGIIPGGRMMRVVTDGDRNGVTNVFGDFNTGPDKVFACAWIYLVSGEVGIGTGNGGNTGLDIVLRKTGSWEYVPVSNGVSPANEFIIYSLGGGAHFFVESAQVSTGQRFCFPQ